MEESSASNEKTVSSIVVYVTAPNKYLGNELAASIVKEKLAACVNRVRDIKTVYLCRGELCKNSEELLIIITRESRLHDLIEHVKANHNDELGEVVALPIVGGSIPFLERIKNSTRD